MLNHAAKDRHVGVLNFTFLFWNDYACAVDVRVHVAHIMWCVCVCVCVV